VTPGIFKGAALTKFGSGGGVGETAIAVVGAVVFVVIGTGPEETSRVSLFALCAGLGAAATTSGTDGR
jgi:hypothetical protein